MRLTDIVDADSPLDIFDSNPSLAILDSYVSYDAADVHRTVTIRDLLVSFQALNTDLAIAIVDSNRRAFRHVQL